MVQIQKAKEQRNNKDIKEICNYEYIYKLKYCDGVFWRVNENNKSITQDKYLICHDIIAELFFNSLCGGDYAYTSSSTIAGHHNNDGTLIFFCGEPYYCFDNEDNFFLELVEEF